MGMPDKDTALGRIRILRAGGCVQRYHTARTARTQTVADHSWGVAALVAHVYPEASAMLLKAALFHDMSETITGDIPAPAKWHHPELGRAEHTASGRFNTQMGLDFELSIFEYDVLKWCDMMELVLWCAEEARLGNTYIVHILSNGLRYLQDKGFPTDRCEDLMEEFVQYVQPIISLGGDWYA